jgi:hypothetical protein
MSTVAAEAEIEDALTRLDRRREALEAQWAGMRAEFAIEEDAAKRFIAQKQSQQEKIREDAKAMAKQRKSDTTAGMARNGRGRER